MVCPAITDYATLSAKLKLLCELSLGVGRAKTQLFDRCRIFYVPVGSKASARRVILLSVPTQRADACLGEFLFAWAKYIGHRYQLCVSLR